MPERIEDVEITLLWSRANSLRRALAAHDILRAQQKEEGVNEPGLLQTATAERLRDLIETYNLFNIGDPKGRGLDTKRLGPIEREAIKTILDDARTIVASLAEAPAVATEKAAQELEAELSSAPDEPKNVHEEQASALARDSTANAVAELLRRAYSGLRAELGLAWKSVREGAYRQIGGAMALAAAPVAIAKWTAIQEFVFTNAEALKRFVTAVFHNPILTQIIDAIATHISQAAL